MHIMIKKTLQGSHKDGCFCLAASLVWRGVNNTVARWRGGYGRWGGAAYNEAFLKALGKTFIRRCVDALGRVFGPGYFNEQERVQPKVLSERVCVIESRPSRYIYRLWREFR